MPLISFSCTAIMPALLRHPSWPTAEYQLSLFPLNALLSVWLFDIVHDWKCSCSSHLKVPYTCFLAAGLVKRRLSLVCCVWVKCFRGASVSILRISEKELRQTLAQCNLNNSPPSGRLFSPNCVSLDWLIIRPWDYVCYLSGCFITRSKVIFFSLYL